MKTGNSDDRGDWAKEFFSPIDFENIVNRTERFLNNEQEGLMIPLNLTNNECIMIMQIWDKATRLRDEDAQRFIHNEMIAIITFINDYLLMADIDWRNEPDMTI